jgi:predicted MarR family transcription regulator
VSSGIDLQQVYVKGQYFTVEQIQERYALAITINNEEIIKELYETDRPLKVDDLCRLIHPKNIEKSKASILSGLTKLKKNQLVVELRSGRTRLYLLSKKGALTYQMRNPK